jgi:medium-chain acyl-[acyl-carrier-protein] hydrolase
MRLVCFPHCGGNASAFFSWGPQLGAEIECVSVQYAGRGQRLKEAPLTTVADLVGEIGHNWGELCDLPFAFYGHSFGGLVAFELSRYLRRQGAPDPQWLFVGASPPPHFQPPFPVIHTLPDDELIETIQTRYGGIPAAIVHERELLNLLIGAMRADFKAFEEYKVEAGASVAIPITAFAGAEDTATTAVRMQEWSSYTEAEFDMKVLDGGHFFRQSSVATLIDTVKARMLRMDSDGYQWKRRVDLLTTRAGRIFGTAQH